MARKMAGELPLLLPRETYSARVVVECSLSLYIFAMACGEASLRCCSLKARAWRVCFYWHGRDCVARASPFYTAADMMLWFFWELVACEEIGFCWFDRPIWIKSTNNYIVAKYILFQVVFVEQQIIFTKWFVNPTIVHFSHYAFQWQSQRLDYA